MMTPIGIPAMMRFLTGKFSGAGWLAMGNSLTMAPRSSTFSSTSASSKAIVQPVLSVGDHSLEFQIAVAPLFPGRLDVQVAQLVSHHLVGDL